MSRVDIVTKDPQMVVQKKIKVWAKKNHYSVLLDRWGFIKLKISKGYSRAIVVYYILTFWIGAIIHRILRIEHGKMYIYLHPYGSGTYLSLRWGGKEAYSAMKDLKKHINAKTFKASQRRR
jgi:hypothetical protein